MIQYKNVADRSDPVNDAKKYQKYTSLKEKRHHGSDQEVWNNFSEDTVQLIAQMLRKEVRESAKVLLSELGKRRQFIAQELKHLNSSLGVFGAFRNDPNDKRFLFRERIGTEDRYYSEACEYCDSIEPTLITEYNGEKYLVFSKSDESEENALVANKNFKILRNLGKGTNLYFKAVTVLYPSIDNESENNFFIQVDQYIDQLLKWQPSEGLDNFFKIAGELAYDFYRFLPYKLGTAGIANWLVRGIALAKGIEIGPEKGIGLPPDWKAFFTNTKEKYSEWYKDNVYADIKLLAPTEQVTQNEEANQATQEKQRI